MKIRPAIKKTLPFLLLITVMHIFSCSAPRRSIAIEDGWDLLGEEKVDFVKETDVLEVHSTNKLTSIRFKVEKHEIRLNSLKIYFQNGDKLEPSIDDVIGADQYSKIIDLSQDGKFVTKIEFKYRTTGNITKGRADVLVFGKRYSGY